MRDLITLVCDTCKRKNYTSTKNKKKTTEKLALKSSVPPAEPTSCTRKARSRRGQAGSVALTARAPDSKSGGCRFESCLTRRTT